MGRSGIPKSFTSIPSLSFFLSFFLFLSFSLSLSLSLSFHSSQRSYPVQCCWMASFSYPASSRDACFMRAWSTETSSQQGMGSCHLAPRAAMNDTFYPWCCECKTHWNGGTAELSENSRRLWLSEIHAFKGFPANFDAAGERFPDFPAARNAIPAKVWALSGKKLAAGKSVLPSGISWKGRGCAIGASCGAFFTYEGQQAVPRNFFNK